MAEIETKKKEEYLRNSVEVFLEGDKNQRQQHEKVP
jgi:hypothetical protein